jgi:acyl-CoA synthetase (AMP-forming)/AMP-acid ligase II
MNLVKLLEERAAETPDAPALIECGGRVTFGELVARVRAGAAEFRRRGVGVGEFVLFLHPVSVDLYVALLAAMRVGAVPMLVDPSAGIAGFHRAVSRTRPVAWTGCGKGRLVKWLVPTLWTVPRVFPERAKGADMDDPPEAVGDDAPALVTFTSGSTGVPKAAVRTHGFLLTQNRVLGKAIELRPGEVDLVTLPVFALANLAHGVASVLAAGDAATVARQVVDERVTRCAVSPAFLAGWLDAGVPVAGLEKVFTGGGPVFPNLLDRLKIGSPKASVCAVYGSTEAEPIAHLEAEEIAAEDLDRMRSGGGLLAGRPVEEIGLAILPDQWGRPFLPMDGERFRTTCLPPGEAGEIVVSGEHVLSGYLGGVGDEETKFKVDGVVWHRTGDAGKLDEQGRLWLLGRCGAVIRDERGALFPFAIETMLSFSPGIRRSAVVAVGGRRILAVECDVDAVPAAPVGIDEVRRMDRIPVDRRHRAKIDYPALRKVLGSGG